MARDTVYGPGPRGSHSGSPAPVRVMDLTADEVRLIEGQRALAGMQVNKGHVAQALLLSIRRLIDLGFEINPRDPLWVQLRHVLPEVTDEP